MRSKPQRRMGKAVLLWFSGSAMSVYFSQYLPSAVRGIGEKSASIIRIPSECANFIDCSICSGFERGCPMI